MLIQNKLKQQMSYGIHAELVQNFCHLRIHAEQEAEENTKKESVTINDIYEILTKKFQLSNVVRDLLMNLEIEQELDAVRPIPKMIQVLDFLHERQSRVVFISDMYLPKDIIQKILEKVGAYKEGDVVYVSTFCPVLRRRRGPEYYIRQ